LEGKMNTKLMLTVGAALGLVLASAASAQTQMPSALTACPAGTKYAETEAGGKGPKLAATEGAGTAHRRQASTEGAGNANPKLATTEGAGGANPKLATTEGAGGANPKLASAQAGMPSDMAKKLSNGVARMPDGTYCSPVQ
jgi:hypothetical protein